MDPERDNKPEQPKPVSIHDREALVLSYRGLPFDNC